MAYSIEISKHALNFLEKIPKNYYIAIRTAISNLADNPRPFGYKKLQGYDNFYRIRVGMYRIIYSIYDGQLHIFIIDIGHRKNIYE